MPAADGDRPGGPHARVLVAPPVVRQSCASKRVKQWTQAD